ncbi:MAG: phosphate ABC transporter permease subunit PstC [Deltaproteobacteria bacterium CG11_big_fil_rev_8_21_14_0_20_45_16]|nr:MAG: phosphate ABC transporter permease subunit PstC [Deltaproteobacteria bacterium CG11_big_fil_rev_8_21_14_0_20_45_16]
MGLTKLNLKAASAEGSSIGDPSLTSVDSHGVAAVHAYPQVSLARSWNSPSGNFVEQSLQYFLFACALSSVLTTFGIVFILLKEMSGFFSVVSVWEFFTGTQWFPLLSPARFGVLPLVSGTLMIALGSCLIAVPIGLLIAIFLSEYCPRGFRVILKSALELLAGIPTVVYGYLALTFVTPQLAKIFPQIEVFNALSACIVVGIMIIPTIASVTEDAIHSVPGYLRDAGYGLGMRRYQIVSSIVFPAAISGFVASIILGLSRAIGETMAVTLAAGASPKLTFNFFESIQTMTAFIVQVSQGDTPAGTIEYQSIFVVGFCLFIMTLGTNLIAQFVVRRIHHRI